jgi:hypothetical protein
MVFLRNCIYYLKKKLNESFLRLLKTILQKYKLDAILKLVFIILETFLQTIYVDIDRY